MDCVEYLTHENPKEEAKGKYLYPDSAVRANFDFHAELTVRAERKAKYGCAADRMMPVKEMEIHVLQDGWSVRQSVLSPPPGICGRASQAFQALSCDYLAN